MASSSDMADARVPYVDQDPQEVAAMIEALRGNPAQGKGTQSIKAKKTTLKVDDSRDNITIDSWRLNDWDYKKGHVPTHARGLFTTRNDSSGQHEIVARGYDKFFNNGEVAATGWPSIKANTMGPYELTLKENGCIIFISGLEDGTLLVCSKHSTGARADTNLSHAHAGTRSLERQLAAVGRTKADLARELRRRNATAVAELCDDGFEEHILEYPPDKAGLYLHGINLNMPTFVTYPSPQVQNFGRDWGFREIGVIMMDDVDEVRTFLEGCAETGSWGDRAVEGFVIRCRMSEDPARLPYHDWFFKYKFEEPYLMYRQWRECTKALIAGKPPKFKKHVAITKEYLNFAKPRLAADPKLAKAYNENHGIIKMRDDFLAHKQMKGSEAAGLEAEAPEAGANPKGDVRPHVTNQVIISPIATIGCGKTTVAVALARLFGWGHIQNDDIYGKGRPPIFVARCLGLLPDHAAVIGDRNNAERRERIQIINDIKLANPAVTMVALHYVHDDLDAIRKVARERVIERGDNHQTIQAGTHQAKFIGVMEGFLRRFEPLDTDKPGDRSFDTVIELDPVAGSRQNLETVVRELHRTYPNLVKEMPSEDAMNEAVASALDYRPPLKDNAKDQGGHTAESAAAAAASSLSKARALEYMAVNVPADAITATLTKAFKNKDAETAHMFNQLKKTRRVQPKFHVTLIHRSSSGEKPDLWNRYASIHTQAVESGADGGDDKVGECDVMLERVVWNKRIMAIVVRLAEKEGGGGPWECANRVAHITVGTANAAVKPKESNDLLTKWLDDGVDGTGIRQIVFEASPLVPGVVKGVSRK